MENFIRNIRKYVPISECESDKIKSCIEFEHVPKNSHILNEGEITRYNYFIRKGCLHLYIIDENGKVKTMQFAIENWWITDLNSFFSQSKAKFYLQALEDTELFKINFKNYNFLINHIPSFESFIRIIFQKSFAKYQELFFIMIQSDGKKRYLNFLQQYPEISQRVPQYMIASYLGLTPEFISRIRKNRTF